MTHVYEEHYYEFVGSSHNLEQPSFLRDGSPCSKATDRAGQDLKLQQELLQLYLLYPAQPLLGCYKRSLPANSTGPNMASLIWVIIINLNKYRLNSVFVSAFLMLLLSTLTLSRSGILYYPTA